MPYPCGKLFRALPLAALLIAAVAAPAAQGGNSASVRGTVTDPSGAVIPGATVKIVNTVSGLSRTTKTDAAGEFEIDNVPFNTYNLAASAPGFASQTQSLTIRSTVATALNLVLQIQAAADTVTVEANAGDAVETDPTFHTDVDRDMFAKIPLESATSSLSSMVTATTPGVSADSNGQAHGLGDHASNSYSVDGQSITDQQSKTFSNQLPSNSIQSLQVIAGAPPAEYGGKTSLVIVATTRSGQGVTKPTGSIYGSYGTFGTANTGFDISYGGKRWGNFVELDGLNTGRFLDPPEFAVFHDKGNEENFFDRVDYSFSSVDSIHIDLNYSRSWFQNPNAYDNLNVNNVMSGGTSPNPTFGIVGDTDQRSRIGTINISPTYTRVINNNTVFNFGAFVRRDDYNYYPSDNPLADLGPANLQTSSIEQNRTLTNTGIHSDVSYAKGIHTFKAGLQFSHTFLRENDNLGIVEATYDAPCVDATGSPLPGYADPSQCGANGSIANPNYLPVLAPYDLTRGGGFYNFRGRADIKETALYIEDQIKNGNWQFNLGMRGDIYNGLTSATQPEPRVGAAYTVSKTGTVVRISYARTLETPFNENLVLSSNGCGSPVLAPLLSCTAGVSTALDPGFRNEFHAGLEQAFGKNLIFSGEYIWKYTHNAFDFSVLGNTPITFPINWHNSKIPGYALHVTVPNYHGINAYSVMSSVAARVYPPQVAGAGATVGHTGFPFRLDHDERFNQTSHLQYTWSRGKMLNGLWGGLNWHYDSGQVAGAAPCYNPLSNDPNTACDSTSTTLNGQPAIDLGSLTADEEFQAGLMCGGQKATPGNPLPSICPASGYTSTLLRIPAPGTGNNDHNPPRIAPRSLFDVSLGKSNLFHTDRFKADLDLTAVNVTNNYALFNFLSTFSGTHYVTPRSLTAKVTLSF
jgi:hypothetical protein